MLHRYIHTHIRRAHTRLTIYYKVSPPTPGLIKATRSRSKVLPARHFTEHPSVTVSFLIGLNLYPDTRACTHAHACTSQCSVHGGEKRFRNSKFRFESSELHEKKTGRRVWASVQYRESQNTFILNIRTCISRKSGKRSCSRSCFLLHVVVCNDRDIRVCTIYIYI